MRKEFGLEYAVEQRVRVVRAGSADGEPVVLEIAGADEFDRIDRNGALHRDLQLSVDHSLLDEIDIDRLIQGLLVFVELTSRELGEHQRTRLGLT